MIDLNVFFRPTVDTARLAYQALVESGVPLAGMDHTDLLHEQEHLRFGSQDDHIAVLSSIREMNFDQVWRDRVFGELDGVEIPFISKVDLIAK